MEEIPNLFLIRVKLAKRRIFWGKIRQESFCPKSTRKVLCLDAGLVQLVDIVPAGSPKEVWSGQGHELRLEIVKRGQLDWISVSSEFCLPIVQNIKFDQLAEGVLWRRIG